MIILFKNINSITISRFNGCPRVSLAESTTSSGVSVVTSDYNPGKTV